MGKGLRNMMPPNRMCVDATNGEEHEKASGVRVEASVVGLEPTT